MPRHVRRLAAPLRIPKAWGALLDIEDLDEIEPFPNKKPLLVDEDAHLVDPTPYRDDQRIVGVVEGDIAVDCRLNSGSTNYYLSWEVHDLTKARNRDGSVSYDEGTELYGSWAGDNIDHDLPAEGEMDFRLSDGSTLYLTVILEG